MSTQRRYGVIDGFPSDQRDAIWNELVAGASGQCQLCEEPMDVESEDVIIEHKINGGALDTSNLYIAHKGCNTLKGDLPYEEAKTMITFKRFCESTTPISFDNIIDKYIPGGRNPIKIELTTGLAKVMFSTTNIVNVRVYVDPASDTQYFFHVVPIKYIHNDIDVQPRPISWSHSWKMYLDFKNNPVHEPSSCRIHLDSSGVGRLLQFDGQHKTTAQILLRRTDVPIKVYINPNVTMIKDLILAIQNRIQKMPLAPAVYLEKMSDVYVERLRASACTSESQFVNSFLRRERVNAKKQVFASIYENIRSNSSNRLFPYIQPTGSRSGRYPISMNLFMHTLKELVCQDLQSATFGSTDDCRLLECSNVVFALNVLSDELLSGGKWPLDGQSVIMQTDYDKAKRFFKSGAVKYWSEILRDAVVVRLNLIDGPEKARLLLRSINDAQKEAIKLSLLRLANHPIWTDTNGDIDSKLNENNIETSKTLFRTYGTPLKAAYLVDMPS